MESWILFSMVIVESQPAGEYGGVVCGEGR